MEQPAAAPKRLRHHLFLTFTGELMAKKGIQHLLCKKHGARGLVVVVAPPTTPHFAAIHCRLCNRRSWINWCSEKHIEELYRTYGENIGIELQSDQPAPSIPPPAPAASASQPPAATHLPAPSKTRSRQQVLAHQPSPTPRSQRRHLPSVHSPTQAQNHPRRRRR